MGIVYSKILKESKKKIYFKYVLNMLLIIISLFISWNINIQLDSFVKMICYGIIVIIMVTIVTLLINRLFLKAEIRKVIQYIKNMINNITNLTIK